MDYLVMVETRRGYYEHLYNKPPRPRRPFILNVTAPSEAAARLKAHYIADGMGLGQVVVRHAEVRSFGPDAASLPDIPWYQAKIGVFDLETTGLDVERDCPVEIGVLEYDLASKSFTNAKTWMVKPDCPMSPGAQAVHKIPEEAWADAPEISEVAHEIKEHLESFDVLIAHNDGYDQPMIRHTLARHGAHVNMPPTWCSMLLALNEIDEGRLRQGKAKLELLSEELGLPLPEAHRAEYDAAAAGDLFMTLARGNPFFRSRPSFVEACAYMLGLKMPAGPLKPLNLKTMWERAGL